MSRDFAVTGSAMSLNMTPAANRHKRNSSGLENYVSVKDLCNGKDNFIKTLKMDDSSYKVPVYSWSKTKFSDHRSKKLDYINLFPEKLHPKPEELTKITQEKSYSCLAPKFTI